jgi:flagellin-like hook-associated protein FlgL
MQETLQTETYRLDSLDLKLTSLLSDAQDADIAEYATKLSVQEIALQASCAMAAKIGNTTILNFLK